MPPQDPATKTVEFDGQSHEFPADFSDADIAKALKTYKPAAPAGPSVAATGPATDESSVVSGALKHAWNTLKSPFEAYGAPKSPGEAAVGALGAMTGVPGALPIYRSFTGAAGAEKAAGSQAKEQFGQGVKSAKVGQYGDAAGRFGEAAVTGASMLNPMATGPVVDINSAEAKNKNREAIGGAAFDGLMMVLGNRAKEPTFRQRQAGLTAAIGETGETAENVGKFMNDMVETAKKNGQPRTVEGLQQNMTESNRRINDEFDTAMSPIRNQKIMPSVIERKIMDLITPDMKNTAEGRAEIQQIKNAATEYQKPWSYNELNSKRMRAGSQLSSFYNKGASGQMSTLKSDMDAAITKAVRDGAAEEVFKGIDRANPGMDTRALKARQSAGIVVRDALDNEIGRLQDKQLAREGRGLRDRIGIRGTLGESGPRGYLSGLKEAIPGSGAKDAADRSVRRAFPAPPTVRKSLVLGLPVSRLGRDDEDSKLPPPPEQ